jgi:hypothetical protein
MRLACCSCALSEVVRAVRSTRGGPGGPSGPPATCSYTVSCYDMHACYTITNSFHVVVSPTHTSTPCVHTCVHRCVCASACACLHSTLTACILCRCLCRCMKMAWWLVTMVGYSTPSTHLSETISFAFCPHNVNKFVLIVPCLCCMWLWFSLGTF